MRSLVNFINRFPLIFLLIFLSINNSTSSSPVNQFKLMTQTHSRHHHKHPHAWHKFGKLVHAKKGNQVEGIADLKNYFHHFGYYHHLKTNNSKNFTNEFDEHLELVVSRYQKLYGLPETGTLNPRTMSMIMSPRCGMPDHFTAKKRHFSVHQTQHYLYFPGQPRWARQIPMTLTYAFSRHNMTQYLSLQETREAFERAFAKWSSVVPVTFVETDNYGLADIKIGFYEGDHGDGDAFDGVLGVLAHAFSPESGRLHLDGAERWAVDFRRERSKVAVDLESVALHEIGHILGLSHSNVKESVMYPSLKPRERKWKLKFDDIEGVQNLYGSNPNFTYGALLESMTSSSPSTNNFSQVSARLASFLLLMSSIVYLCI